MRPSLCLAAAALALMLADATPADPPRRQPREGSLKVGDPAPALAADELHSGKTVRLADLKGQPVVLIFGSCT
jgi:cytochrome oxidase Cu insertion factor (SCO1/SenC/PrrC family)